MFSFTFNHRFPNIFFICPGQLWKGTNSGDFRLGWISNWGASGWLGCPWLISCFTLKVNDKKTIKLIQNYLWWSSSATLSEKLVHIFLGRNIWLWVWFLVRAATFGPSILPVRHFVQRASSATAPKNHNKDSVPRSLGSVWVRPRFVPWVRIWKTINISIRQSTRNDKWIWQYRGY